MLPKECRPSACLLPMNEMMLSIYDQLVTHHQHAYPVEEAAAEQHRLTLSVTMKIQRHQRINPDRSIVVHNILLHNTRTRTPTPFYHLFFHGHHGTPTALFR